MKSEVRIHFRELYFFSFPVDLILYRANPHLSRVMCWSGRGDTLSPAAQNTGTSQFFLRPCVASKFPRETLHGFVLRRRWVRGPAARMQSVFVLIRILNYNRAQSSEVPLHYC